MVFILIPVYMINICILDYCMLLVQLPATVFKSEINETIKCQRGVADVTISFL